MKNADERLRNICRCRLSSLLERCLVERDAETEASKLVKQHVERFRNAWSRHRVALDDGLVSL